jgi:hypothetical protein
MMPAGGARAGAGPRRGIALAATALAAVALAIGVGGRGCSADDETPEGAVRAFTRAARAGDRETLHQLLGPATRAWLEESARRASQLVNGPTRYAAVDLIAAGRVPAAPARIALRDRRRARARVEVVDDLGQRSTIDLVEVEGRWRLELLPRPDGS